MSWDVLDHVHVCRDTISLSTLTQKVPERLLLSRQVNTFQDPLQFAYHLGVGVENTIIYLLQGARSYQNKAGSTVRIMFFDFSSAFIRI